MTLQLIHKKLRLWKFLKNELKREGRAGDNDDMYIFQFIYLHQQRNKGNRTPQEIFPHFLWDLAAVYPGHEKQGLRPLEYKVVSEYYYHFLFPHFSYFSCFSMSVFIMFYSFVFIMFFTHFLYSCFSVSVFNMFYSFVFIMFL